MGKIFSETITLVVEFFNSYPFLWGLIFVSLFISICALIFRFVMQDETYTIIDFFKDTIEFLVEYFKFKFTVKKLMKYKLNESEILDFFSFYPKSKESFSLNSFVTVKDCFNLIFEEDYNHLFYDLECKKSSKYIIKLLNRYYNYCLCERLKFNLSYVYNLEYDELKIISSSFLHVDSLFHGYSGIPFSDYEKK